MNWRNSAAAAVVVLATAACHPARPAHPAPPAPAPQLTSTIDAILSRPAFTSGHWGVVVRSLSRGETLYSRNADKLLMPASNMKIVTLAAAAARLGWSFTYQTTLQHSGRVANGTLDGDLIIIGSGDPSLVLTDRMADRVFDGWADRLKASGISTIRGRVIGDDRAFTDEGLGFGWSWDDLPDDYAAAIGPLQINEDAVRVTIVPGPSAGASAGVSAAPADSGLVIDNALVTTAAGTQASIGARRLPGSSRLELKGMVPLGGAPLVRVVSVDNPTQFFVNVVRDALIARGIDVQGSAVDIDDVRDVPVGPLASIAEYRSPPLSTIAVRLMKDSQNQYAETLLKTLGAAAGTPTAAGGRASVAAMLESWRVPPSALIQRDGSGLSRYDYVTPAAIIAILEHMYRDAQLRPAFEASLPIAGRDGSLANRMKGTAAEGNVRAKTGSMSNVRALSGYVTTAGGEPLAFAIIANNFDAPGPTITAAIDEIVVAMASETTRSGREDTEKNTTETQRHRED